MIDKNLEVILSELLSGSNDVIPADLRAKYPTLHWCPDWDYLPVAAGCPEYESCNCDLYKEDP